MNTNHIIAASIIIAIALTGCATEDEFEPGTGFDRKEMKFLNGLDPNAPTAIGLRAGVDEEYLGLSDSALAQNQAWLDWMEQDPDAPTAFGYLVLCALDSTQTVSAITINGTVYGPWTGSAGLATDWATANNDAQTQAEQELVSSCLLANANATGNHVWISLRSQGLAPPDSTEVAQYSKSEGQFFGNVFLANPVKGVCRADDTNAATSQELIDENRLCADDPEACGYEDYGNCSSACSSWDSTQGMYASCEGYETAATYVDPS